MARKRRTKKRKTVKPRYKSFISQKTKNLIKGISLLILALFSLFAILGQGGIVGEYFLKILNFFFGEGKIAFPFWLILFSALYFSYNKQSSKPLFVLVSFLGLALFGFFANFEHLSRLERSILGGWIGSLISYPLFKLFGFWFSFAILLGVIFGVLGGLWYFGIIPKVRLAFPRRIARKEIQKTEKRNVVIKKIFTPKFQVKSIEEPTKSEALRTKIVKEKPIPISLKKKPQVVEIGTEKFKLPPLNLLEADKGTPNAGDVKLSSEIIKRTLENFGIPVEMHGANVGPTVTQYTLKPAEGVKLSKITSLSNNLALALAAHPIRIEAPIPGKSLVGIEVPNKTRTLVRLRNLLSLPEFQAAPPLTFALGRDVVGNPVFADLSRMPHLLVAGATGTGKTICLNSIILSFLFKNTPKTLRLILVDPKRVEFSHYFGIPHLVGPVIYDVNKTIKVLRWLIEEMERRFDLLGKVGARNIFSYNKKVQKNKNLQKEGFEIMPFIVLIIDELADLMAQRARDLEIEIVKLAQKARATGIHLILATQRPSVEVITGLIKANIIARIAFQVASQVDSRTILDMAGAERLLGNGDMLFISADYSKPKRIQGAYVSEKEIEKVVKFIKENQEVKGPDPLRESLEEFLEREEEGIGEVLLEGEKDPLYEEAKRLVIQTRKASASFLQRKLRIGYARAARLLDMMEEEGIVGPSQGAKPREVYIKAEDLEETPSTSEDFGSDYNEINEEENNTQQLNSSQ